MRIISIFEPMDELQKLIDEDLANYIQRTNQFNYRKMSKTDRIGMFFKHTKNMFLTDLRKSVDSGLIEISKEELLNFHRNSLFQK